MSTDPRPLCWCGIYVDVHSSIPRIKHRPRKAPRIWVWYIDHSIYLHLTAPIWLRLPSKWRWNIVSWLNRSSRRCWSDLVHEALAEPEDDACNAQVPWPRGVRDLPCASVCDWSHGDHAGEHPCSCYCGKFQFTSAEGYIDRKDGV